MWIIYALLTAFLLATSDALTKSALVSRNEYFVAWARLVFSLPILLLVLLFIDIPVLDRTFWYAVMCGIPLELAAIILYTKALKVSPISMTMPLLALTPVFIIINSYLFLGEEITARGGAGILLMSAGGYALNIHTVRHDLAGPLKAIFREKGALMILVVAFIFSITSVLGKMAIEHSSPLFFGSFYFVMLTVFFTPITVLMHPRGLRIARHDAAPLILIGVTYSVMIIFHMLAMSLTQVAYMISVKRTSLLFSIMYGRLMFGEGNTGEKALGGTLMLAGFALIVSGQ